MSCIESLFLREALPKSGSYGLVKKYANVFMGVLFEFIHEIGKTDIFFLYEKVPGC